VTASHIHLHWSTTDCQPVQLVELDGVHVTTADTIRDLWVTIDTWLSFQRCTIVHSCFYQLRQLRSVRRSVPNGAIVHCITSRTRTATLSCVFADANSWKDGKLQVQRRAMMNFSDIHSEYNQQILTKCKSTKHTRTAAIHQAPIYIMADLFKRTSWAYVARQIMKLRLSWCIWTMLSVGWLITVSNRTSASMAHDPLSASLPLVIPQSLWRGRVSDLRHRQTSRYDIDIKSN